MEFCSEYGYDYGFEGSDSEEYSSETEDTETKQKIKHKVRKADTNIIAVKFNELVAANESFAGEPKYCKNCSAVVSGLSVVDKVNGKMMWKCEFCFENNDMTTLIEDVNEIPKKLDVTFMLEGPKEVQKPSEAAKNDGVKSQDNSYLAFCIDVSGSMDTSIPVKQGEQNNNVNRIRNNSDSDSGDDSNANVQVQQMQQVQQVQYNNYNRRNYNSGMTRLDGVKAASLETLKSLKENEPERKVALVTFSDVVKYYGDATNIQNNQPILSIGNGYGGGGYMQQQQQQLYVPNTSNSFTSRIKGFFNRSPTASNQSLNEASVDDLNNKERLLTLANNTSGEIKSVSQSHKHIESRIKQLHTEGSTALGPALVYSIGFASKKPGSSIILCTDGCANVGIGSIENANGAEKFYDDIADYAKDKGVTVNVISMEGTDCKLAVLGRVADRSNGTLSIVNPLNLSDEFKSILENRLIATNVQAKLIVNHKYIYIRDADLEAEEQKIIQNNDLKAKEELEKKKKSIIVRDIGNANIDTEITFEYGIRKLNSKEEKPEALKEVPFQLQITYTAQDGSRSMRVYTKKQQFTRNREEAEKKVASEEIIYAHNAQAMSNQVLKSNIAASKFRSRALDNLLERNKFVAPDAYQQANCMIQSFSYSQQADQLNDVQAERMFKNAKMSRAKLAKKK